MMFYPSTNFLHSPDAFFAPEGESSTAIIRIIRKPPPTEDFPGLGEQGKDLHAS